MTRRAGVIAACAALAIGALSAPPPRVCLLWNRTDSAPKGLYLVTRAMPETGDWAAVSGKADSAEWIAAHGYIGPGWLVIKRVAAARGDEICREGARIFINGAHVAIALKTDSAGQQLPAWSGCKRLGQDEFFLLNDHPRSLDGRYFGATRADDIDGKARLLWSVKR